jgi:putative ABC transport system permease protein
MIRLAFASLRSRLAAFLGTFVAAVLAVALIGGAALLLFSVLTATPTTHRFDTADVMVGGAREISLTTVKNKGKGKQKTKTKTERLAGAPTLPSDWAGKVAAMPGVTQVTEDFSFPVTLTTLDGRPLGAAVGHGWASAALTPFTVQDGSAPKPGELTVDPSLNLRLGDRVRLVTRTGSLEMTVAGLTGQHLTEQAAVFLNDAEVAAVSGLAGPTALAVRAAEGPDAVAQRIRTALGVETVYTGAAKVHADLPAALPDYIGAISIFGFVIGITTFATVFVLTGTVTLAVRQRLRELALLRATGATPRQLWRLLSAETLMVTLAATVGGLPLGVLAAQVIAGRFRTLGAVPEQFEVSLNVAVLLAAAGLTLLVAQLSARLAARRALRIAPAQALQETVVEQRDGWFLRTAVALVCATGAAVILAVVPLDGPFGMGMTFISSALLLCSLGAAGPLLVRLLGAALSRIAGVTGIAGWLAGAFTRAENRRVTAVAVPLALMIAINAPMLLNGALSRDLAGTQQQERAAAATSVATGAAPLSTVRELTGDFTATLPTRLIIDEGGKPEDYAAYGLYVSGMPGLDLGFSAGGWTGDGLAASAYLARARGWQVGRTVQVWLPDGHPVELRLTGVFERSRGFGDLIAPAALVAAHDPHGLVTSVYLRSSTQVPGMRVTATDTVLKANDADEQQGAWEIMIAISLGFTAIAVLNTFAVAAAARRAHFAQLRLLGATPRQIRRMTAREAALTVAVGLTLGVAVTSIVVAAFSVAQDGVLRLVVDPASYGTLVAGVGVLGLLAGVIPARLVLRGVRPV